MRASIVIVCVLLHPTIAMVHAQEPAPVLNTWTEAADAAPSFRSWTRVDYLLWWTKPVCLKPPTVSTGNPGDTTPGALGEPGTTVVLGGSKFEFAGASGIRPAVGFWFTPDGTLGFEASGHLTEQRAANQSVSLGAGNAPGYLPYQDPQNVQQALPFSLPGVVDATALAAGRSRLWGTEANLVTAFEAQRGACLLRATYLFGFRQLDLSESVELTSVQTLVADPAQFAMGHNAFQTRNQFYGAQIGGRFAIQRDNWNVEMGLKLAAGETRLSVAISGGPLTAGESLLDIPGNPARPLLPGPILALPSNSGRITTWRVSFVPEADIRFSYRIGDALRLSLGYSLIYLNRNVCPGDQMSTIVNISQLPGYGPVAGPAQPKDPFVRTDYFAAGLALGAEWRY